MEERTLLAGYYDRSIWINICWFVLIVVTTQILIQIIFYRFIHPLKDFPGPFWWGVTRIPLAWNNFWDTEISTERKLIAKYGQIVRISPTLLLVSTASTLPKIYHRTARKTPHYTLFSFGAEPNVFHMLEHAEYANRAKTIAGIYTSRAHMPSTECIMDKHLMGWASKLATNFANHKLHGKKAAFDIAPWIQFLTMDVIIELAFGKENKLGFVENGKDMLYLCWGFKFSLPVYGAVCRMHPFFTWLDTTWFGRFLDWWMLHQDPQIGRLTRFVDGMLNERLKEIEENKGTRKTDMLQAFIDSRTPDGEPLSTTTLRGEVEVVLMAGADNTAAAICTTLFHILKSPSAHARVLSELDRARSAGRLSAAPQHSEILKHCPYYVACVKESLRLNPSLPSFMPRYSSTDPKNPLVILGTVIPPGVEIASNPWITHRDPEIYGVDAEEWIPERWLDADKAKLLEKYNFTFGYGSRLCLGRQLGMMAALKVPLMFLNTFRVSLSTDSSPKLSIRADFSYWEDLLVEIEQKSTGVYEFVSK